jgi:hypothetical protein
MRKIYLVLCVSLLCTVNISLTAEPFSVRVVTEAGCVSFSSGRYRCQFDNTFAFNFVHGFIPEIKNSLIKTDYGERLSLQPGFIFLIGRYTYVETLFGPSIDSENEYLWDGYSEIVTETRKVLISACFRAGFSPSENIFFCIPNTSFLYRFSALYSAKAKYYFGYSSDDFLSHTLCIENIFAVQKNTLVALLSGRIQDTAEVREYAWSIGVRYERQILADLVLKCSAEYLSEPQGIWGINGTCTVDVKF